MIKKNVVQIINVCVLVFVGFSFLNNNAESVIKDDEIKAMVDPAIYKPGDTTFTIYGSCMDSSSHPASSNATITIYNSSQDKYIDNGNMSEMMVGRHNYSMNAPSAPGNYFVEINCSIGSSWAVAHNNFQVADWAEDIDDIEGYLEDVNDGGLSTINTEVAGLDGAAMRGTDNAFLAASYTAERGTDSAETEASAASRDVAYRYKGDGYCPAVSGTTLRGAIVVNLGNIYARADCSTNNDDTCICFYSSK